MKQYVIILGLTLEPSLMAKTTQCLDTNKSMEFKDGKSCDEVENKHKIKYPKKEKTYLAFAIVEAKSSSRSGITQILVDTHGKEITTINIKDEDIIKIEINLAEHKTPITLIYGKFSKKVEKENGKIILEIPTNLLNKKDTIRIEDRTSKNIVEIKTSK